MEHIFSAKSLKLGQLPIAPPLVADLVSFQSFQNASLGFLWYYPYVFSYLVLYCFFKSTLSEQILLGTSQDTAVCSQLEMNFLFFSDTSPLSLIFC